MLFRLGQVPLHNRMFAFATMLRDIPSVQIIYVGASEYALLGADTKPEDDEVG